MILDIGKTPLQAIYENTAIELIEEISESLIEGRDISRTFTEANGLDMSVVNIEYNENIDQMIKKYHNPEKPLRSQAEGSRESYGRNIRDAMEIAKIGTKDLSINDAMGIIKELYKDIGVKLYGALLVSENITFNPLHPLIMSQLVEEGKFNLEEKIYTLAIYTFKPEYQPKTWMVGNEDFTMEIAGIVTSVMHTSLYHIENTNIHVDIENDKFVINYSESFINNETGDAVMSNNMENKVENYLIPAQIINISGIAFPNYGSLYSKKGLAWNLTPMRHANINSPDSNKKLDNGSRICTHSGNSKTQMGLSSLNHCNTTSPLTKRILGDNFITYANKAVEVSLAVMFDGYERNPAKEEEEKPLTFQEFLEEYEDATRIEYISYLKDRINKKLSEKPDILLTNEQIMTMEQPPVSYDRIPRQFVNGNEYFRGDVVMHEGKMYISIENPAVLIPVPGNEHVWLDVTEISLAERIDILKEQRNLNAF